MLCGVTCAPSSSRNSSSASISGSAKTEKRECSTVNEILLGHESDGHGHAHRAVRDASTVAGVLAEFLVDMQRVPVTRNPRESDDVDLAHGTALFS